MHGLSLSAQTPASKTLPVAVNKKRKSAAAKITKRLKRHKVPYTRIAKLWAMGKTITEIAKAVGRYRRDSIDPCHSMRVTLTKMHAGYKNDLGRVVRLPHRVSKKTVRLATAAGKKSIA